MTEYSNTCGANNNAKNQFIRNVLLFLGIFYQQYPLTRFLSMLHTVTRLSISMDKSSHYDTTTNLSVSDIDANRLASVFKLLGDTNRLKLVLACLNEPQAVCCLATKAGMSQPLTSHHLAALKKARILKSERIGKRMLYALDDHHIRHVICDLAAHLQE